MPSNEADELDLAAIAAAYERRVGGVDAEQVPFALRLLEALEPERWRLEWHLPLWLGNAFGVDRRISTEIVVSNVLGLASLRLHDDLVDGDLDQGDIEAAPAMSATLFEASIHPYRARFRAASRFWKQLDRWMAEWKAATEVAGQSEPSGDRSAVQLAHRGAPLKASAYAVCLLAKRSAAFPTIERCLDHAMVALVLYDHVCDWEGDLAAGRWNAFVASTAPSRPAEDRQRTRSDVLAAMMAGNAVEIAFTRIHAELDQAIAACERVGVPALSTHLANVAAQLDREGALLQARYADLGEQAAAAMFGSHRLARRGMLSGTTP